MFGQKHTVEYWRKFRETVPASPETGGVAFGVNHVFVQNGCYERHGMYGHNDDLMRFTVLSWAALEAPFCIDCQGSVFGDDVVFLVNDWMVGLVPLIMTSHYRRYGCYEKARTIFDIHNMGYCGNFGVCNPQDLGLPDGCFFDKLFHDKQIKLLKGGIELADRVVTVSPSYRDEILTPEGGWGLQEACKGRFPHLDGILNGIDEDEWNPATDHYLSAKSQGYDNFYSPEDVSGKKACKMHLQHTMGLNQNPDIPIVAFIGRLAYQKGIDLIEAVFPWLMSSDANGITGNVQLIMMGSGDEKYASFLRNAESNNKGRVAGYVGFTPELEHKILAGADILLMPSRYEPCGLPQVPPLAQANLPLLNNVVFCLKLTLASLCRCTPKSTAQCPLYTPLGVLRTRYSSFARFRTSEPDGSSTAQTPRASNTVCGTRSTHTRTSPRAGRNSSYAACSRTFRGTKALRGTTKSSNGQKWTLLTSTTQSSKKPSCVGRALPVFAAHLMKWTLAV